MKTKSVQIWKTAATEVLLPNETGLPTISGNPCIWGGLILVGDGAHLAVAILYDCGPDEWTGTVLGRAVTKTSVQISGPISCSKGICLEFAGTGAAAVVLYR